MAEVDTSIYRAPERFNPLTSLGESANIANALQQNANAVQQNKLMQQEQVQRDITIDKSQYDLAMNRLQGLHAILAPLAMKKNLTQRDIMDAGINGVAQGAITSKMLSQEATNWGEDTPENNQQIIRNHLFQLQSAADQLKSAYGENENIDQGDTVLAGVRQSPMMGGQFDWQTAVGKHLTPGQLAERVGKVDEEGAPTTVPQSSLVTREGYAKPNPASSGGEVLPDEALSTGNILGQNSSSANRSRLPGEIRTGLVPGEQEAATGSAEALKEAYRSNNTSDERIFQLKQALDALGHTKTGRGTEARVNFANAVTSLIGPELSKNLVGIDPTSDAYFDKAKKYLTQYASNVPGGSRTNDMLSTTLAGSPNVSMSQWAAEDVVKAAIAKERMRQAMIKTFEASDEPVKNYNKWQSSWVKDVDPRVYMMDLLNPEQKKNLIGSLKGDERAKFASQLKNAISNKFIPIPE